MRMLPDIMLPDTMSCDAATPMRSVAQFRGQLLGEAQDRAGAASANAASANSVRELWEASDLSAGKLADEAARFWRVRRLTLQDLVNPSGLTERFSARFLRESSVFPFRAKEGVVLAVSDPADSATIRAVEIVCGTAVEVAVASFDDIATVLERQFAEREAAAADVQDIDAP